MRLDRYEDVVYVSFIFKVVFKNEVREEQDLMCILERGRGYSMGNRLEGGLKVEMVVISEI